MILHRQSSQNPTAQNKSKTEERATEQTFRDHLNEVRKRLFWIVSVLVVTSVIGLQLKDQVTAIIMQPLHGEKLVYLTPGGGFSFIFTVSLYFGALFTIPVAVYHLFRFLQPIIGKTSKKFIAAFLLVSTLLAIAGALFGYYVTIPAALNFLATFAGDAVTPNLTADSYLNFVVTYILGLALIFQLPLLLFIFDHVSPMKPGLLSSTQNYVIIAATVLAAIITPTPDAFNMAVVAIPIVAVYEVGAAAVVIRRQMRNRPKAASRQTLDEIDDEPLTDILNELRQPTVEEQPKPVAQPVPLRQLANEPAVQRVVQQVPQPAAKPTVTATPVHQPVASRPRMVDGFVAAKPSQVRRVVVPPARVAAPSPKIPERHPTPRPVATRTFRSIDGFMTV